MWIKGHLHMQSFNRMLSQAVQKVVVRLGRIELPSHPWQGRVLPLNHSRKNTTAELYYFSKINAIISCYIYTI